MVMRCKERSPTVQAIEFVNCLTQSPEVANLIGATAFSVDMTAKRTTFVVGEITQDTYTVQEGQVIGLIGGIVTVKDATEFYAKYEAI